MKAISRKALQLREMKINRMIQFQHFKNQVFSVLSLTLVYIDHVNLSQLFFDLNIKTVFTFTIVDILEYSAIFFLCPPLLSLLLLGKPCQHFFFWAFPAAFTLSVAIFDLPYFI